MIKAALFDVYGTCVDWRTGVQQAATQMLANRGLDPSFASQIADRWRALYEPSMERVRNGSRAYVPLTEIQRENLNVVLKQLGLEQHFDEAARTELNASWDRLPVWADTVNALENLKLQMPIAACSNGSIDMMNRLAENNRIKWSKICGADIAQNYKPNHEVYQLSARALGVEPAETVMIACHPDDLDYAKAAGLQTGYFPRPSEHGEGRFTPEQNAERFDYHAEDIGQLVRLICENG